MVNANLKITIHKLYMVVHPTPLISWEAEASLFFIIISRPATAM